MTIAGIAGIAGTLACGAVQALQAPLGGPEGAACTGVSEVVLIVLPASSLTELDRRETTLWRIVGRYDEAVSMGDDEAAARLLDGFKRRLSDYQAACDLELAA